MAKEAKERCWRASNGSFDWRDELVARDPWGADAGRWRRTVDASCRRRRPAAEAVGLAAARVKAPWVMVVFPCRRCAEVPRDRNIAPATYHSESEGIPQGPAPVNPAAGRRTVRRGDGDKRF